MCKSENYEDSFSEDENIKSAPMLDLNTSKSKDTQNDRIKVPDDFQNKLDLSKFRTAYVSVKIN